MAQGSKKAQQLSRSQRGFDKAQRTSRLWLSGFKKARVRGISIKLTKACPSTRVRSTERKDAGCGALTPQMEHLPQTAFMPPLSSEYGTHKTAKAGLGFQEKVLKTFSVVPSSLGSVYYSKQGLHHSRLALVNMLDAGCGVPRRLCAPPGRPQPTR